MKKMIFSAIMLTTCAATTFAFAPKQTEQTATPQKGQRAKIDPTSLPAAIKTILASDAYKDWTVESAWQNTSTSEYVVILKKDDKTTKLKFDKDGKQIS